MQPPDPFECRDLTKQEHAAIKAVYAGNATEHQQRLCLEVIVNTFSRAHDLLIVPGSPDGTGILNGRAFVGQKILKYLNLPVGKLKTTEEHQ